MSAASSAESPVAASTVEPRKSGSRPDGSHQARGRCQSQEIVASEERLQDDVVEREGQRRSDHDQRPLRALERQLLSRPERDDDRDTAERDREPEQAPRGEALEPDGDGQHQRHARCKGDDERRNARRRVLGPEVQREVVAEDDYEPSDDHPSGIAARQAGKAAGAPEDEREPGGGDRVPE